MDRGRAQVFWTAEGLIGCRGCEGPALSRSASLSSFCHVYGICKIDPHPLQEPIPCASIYFPAAAETPANPPPPALPSPPPPSPSPAPRPPRPSPSPKYAELDPWNTAPPLRGWPVSAYEKECEGGRGWVAVGGPMLTSLAGTSSCGIQLSSLRAAYLGCRPSCVYLIPCRHNPSQPRLLLGGTRHHPRRVSAGLAGVESFVAMQGEAKQRR